MKPKKSNQANLELRRGLFKQMGIVMALGLTFIAFEYSNADVSNKTIYYSPELTVEIDYVPITQDQVIPPPPPPPALLTKIIIDPFNASIEDEIDIASVDIDDASDMLYFPDEIDEVDDNTIFIAPEIMPEYPGGISALMQFLQDNVKYPSIASEMGIQGRVYVEFIINKNGQVSHVKLLKGVDRHLDNEALRVVNLMPDWTPGYQGGNPVNVSYRLPINFRQQ